jgi:predicted metal-binding membrane protein
MQQNRLAVLPQTATNQPMPMRRHAQDRDIGTGGTMGSRVGQQSAGQPARGTLALGARWPRATLGILALALLGWVFLAWVTLDMSHPFAQLTMPGTSTWSPANVLAILSMWAVMMAAMMLPSALPMMLTFIDLSARSGEPARGRSFVAAYLAVWFAFSAAATAAQWVLQALDWVDMMIISTSPWLTVALLLVAGVYQFSPLKRLCLSRCRTPLGFLLGEWRPGTWGAFAMGARHGLSCLGCCWALMALLFVGGVMNLAWIAALSIAVALEKLLLGGERLSFGLGMALIAIGLVKWALAAG